MLSWKGKWSVAKKLGFLGLLTGLGAGAVLIASVNVVRNLANVQAEFRKTAELNRQFAVVENAFYKMSLAMAGYLAEPNETKWEAKENEDAIVEKELEKVAQYDLGPDLTKIVEELKNFDENYLNPLDLTLKQARKTSSLDFTFRVYAVEYNPLLATLKGKLEEATRMTEVLMKEQADRTEKMARNGWITIALIMGAGMVILLFLLRIVTRSIVAPLEVAMNVLVEKTKETDRATEAINHASQSLAQAATEQAAALQETASSVEEMSAMITKSSENAKRSTEAAHGSSETALKGKQSSEEMLRAIQDINTSNADIMKQIEESNKRLTEITLVIGEIGNKTRVINDIVFQTKLLSFNASVEAARAGEQGKGFAVVAEEVGNLAQMSGTAAKEIGTMLQNSIQKVEAIVADTKKRVENLIADGRQRVETGSVIAQASGKVLDQIVGGVGQVNRMISEIAVAAEEQASGVQEITKAMSQLDQVTQQNSGLSQKIAGAAESLAGQSKVLHRVVEDLQEVVWGSTAETNAKGGSSKFEEIM